VEAMGGRIWVESSGIAGEGSRFYFTLPAAPDISRRSARAAQERVAPSRERA
jgi:signal transduction histidine kinase